jgi:hypothetical protein
MSNPTENLINLLKECTRLSASDASTDPNCIITQETALVNGNNVTLHRIYLRQQIAGRYTDVGWVLDCDAANCMICSKDFWVMLARHHCRSCGNIVCDDCSPVSAIIQELPTTDPQRVCLMCYWGQVYPRSIINKIPSQSLKII